MKGIVIGLGSMGKRRIRLMREFFPDISLCGVDGRADRREEATALFGLPCYTCINEAVMNFAPAVAFVCTSPLSHADIITTLLEAGLHIFTEINLVADGYERNIKLAQEKYLELFLSSTPLYRREIGYVEQTVSTARAPLCYRYHVGQYLPDWHPWENYKDFFVGDRRTNGCREILGIELPWMTCVFGPVTAVHATALRQTALQIDFPDCYLITLEHRSGARGQFTADIVARKAVRDLEIFGEDVYLRWGGTPDSLIRYNIEGKTDQPIQLYDSVRQDGRYAQNIIENAYVDELSAFFGALRGEAVRRHTFSDDAAVLAVMDEIERAGL